MKSVIILLCLATVAALTTGVAFANPVFYGPIRDGMRACPKCNGLGRLWVSDLVKCRECKGSGWLRVCFRCRGSGHVWRWWLWRTACPTCKGSGCWDGWSSGRFFE